MYYRSEPGRCDTEFHLLDTILNELFDGRRATGNVDLRILILPVLQQ